MTALTRVALEQWRLTVALMVVAVAMGLATYVTHPSQEDPEITIRTAVVTVQFPGMPARRVEALLVRPVEEAARQIAEIEEIESAAQQGLARVKVELRPEITDVRSVWTKLRDKMADIAPRLPEGAVGPLVNDDYGRVAVTTLALTGEDFSLAELRSVARWVRDRLAGTPLVGRIDLYGVQPERIWIEVDHARLDRAGLTIAELVEAIADRNVILSAGGIETDQGLSYPIATSGVFERWEEIGEVPVPTQGGGLVRVRDLAVLKRGYVEPVRQPVVFDGAPAVTLGVSMVEGGAIRSFETHLRERLAAIRADLPVGLSLDLVTHQPPIVAASVAEATENLGQTIATVLAVVILFLGIRAGAIVGAIVPLSIVLALIGMALWGIPLHRISIAAVIIALGLLVDNAVVMAEDIKRRVDAGAAARDAALEASRTLAVPLLTSSLTTILAFLPLMLASDATGEFLRALSQVLILTLLASWLLSITITPLFCVWLLRPGAARPAEAPQGRAQAVYAGLLRRALGWRIVVLAGTVAVFAVSLAALSRVPTGLLPPSERAQFVLDLELAAGSSEDETARVARRLAGFLSDRAANPEVTGSVVYVGSGGPRFFLALAPVDPAPHVAFAVVNTADPGDVAPVRARVERWMAANLPEAEGWTDLLFLGQEPPGTVEIRLKGGGVDALYAAGREVAAAFRGIEGTRQVRGDWANPVLQLNVLIDEARARQAGIAPSAVARTLEARFDGARITDYRDGETIIPVILRAGPEDRGTIDALLDTTVLSGEGQAVPLLQVADTGGELQPWVIRRHQQERALTVSALHPQMSAAALLEAVRPRLEALDLPAGMRWEVDGEVRAKEQANGALFATLPQCLLGIVLILIWQFNSFRRPAIILLTIPLVMIGAALGLTLMRGVLDFNAMLGILALAGIIINNAIVLIERIDEERRGGLAVEPAITAACAARLRPIVMTTLTTILGLVPLFLFGGDLWRGMTIVMMFGLGVGTVLTLVVAPCLYALMFRDRPAAA